MKLLVVDDHAHFRNLIKGVVGDLFTDVYEADDGALAMDRYAEHRPDWVLMDLRMKRVSGLQAASQITKNFPEARIIMVTNHNAPELQAAARQAGAWDYVPKENLPLLRGIINSGLSWSSASTPAIY